MLTQKDFQNILQQAENVKTPEEYTDLLRANQEFLPDGKLAILKNADKIIEKNPEIDLATFMQSLKQTSTEYVDNMFQQNIDYLQAHIDSEMYVDSDIKRMKACIKDFQILKQKNIDENTLIYKEISDTLKKNLAGIESSNINQIYNHIKNNFKAALAYKTAVNIRKDETTPQKDITKQAFSRIFQSSVSKISPVQQNSEELNSDIANNILICTSCDKNKQNSLKFYPHNVDYKKLNKNFDNYSRDITNAICNNSFPYPMYFGRMASMVYSISMHSVGLSKDKLYGYKTKIDDFGRKVNFQPLYLNDDIPCSCCGTTMVSFNKMDEISEQVKKAKTLPELNNIIQTNKKYLNRKLLSLADFINDMTVEHPNISYEEAMTEVQIEDAILLQKRFGHIVKKIREKSNSLIGNQEQRDEYAKLADELEEEFIKHKHLGFINFTKYKDIYSKYPVTDQRDAFRLIPLIKYKGKEYIAFYNVAHASEAKTEKYGSEMQAFVRNMFNMSAHTMDHSEAKSRGGDNALNNLIGMCHSCNTGKATHDIGYWAMVNPEMKRNTIKNLKRIDELAKQGKLDGYENYATNVSENLYNISYGTFDIRYAFNKGKTKHKK
jgi:hypothetical protein